MLTRLQIILAKPREIRLSVNMSSLLQGVIMEMISSESATEFHSGSRQPYSQFVQITEDKVVWTIHTMTKKAYEQIIVPLMDEKVESIYIRYKDLELKIVDKEVETVSYEQLRKDYYFTDGSRYQKIQFVTPTAFKSQGQYVFYPSIRLIFQSLMMKYDAFSDDGELFGDEIMEHFEKHVRVVKYKLRSYDFHLEGTKVPAFLGEITVKIEGAQALVNLAQYLLRFGEFAGVGIKCGIGMGGMRCGEKNERGGR